MLKGVVHQPLSVSGTSASAMVTSKKQQTQQQQHQQHAHHEGKEKIVPLTRRPILHRLDVYPFVIGYIVLILLDAHHHSTVPSDADIRTAAAVAILIDVLYILLLLGQLVLFLKCQWDPIWHARVAYRRYRCSSGGANRNAAERKIEDMKTWTHCLVVPPNPYDSSNVEKSASVSTRTAQTVRPEQPGIVPFALENDNGYGNETPTSFVGVIHFRGWTYRCCCNVPTNNGTNDNNEVDDFDVPMESIWKKKGEEQESGTLEEISDEEEENEEEQLGNSTSSSTTTSAWEPHFHRLHFPVDLPLPFYSQWTGHTSHTNLRSTHQIYGLNQTLIPLPPFLSLLTQQLLQPMFLFQLLCVMLWCMDEYWMYAVFTLFTLILFEGIQAMNRWKSVKRLREEVVGADVTENDDGANLNGKKQQRVECYRMGEWITLPTSQLVVGDVISLISPSVHNDNNNARGNNNQRRQQSVVRNAHDHERGSTIPADLLLLTGRAVVNEAMLTGESVPQVKESIEVEDEGEAAANGNGNRKNETAMLDLSDGSAHKKCVLFGGTVLMDHHSASEQQETDNDSNDSTTATSSNNIPTPPNGGLVCFVLRTGFDTVQGSLLRTLAYHAEAGGGGSSGGGEGVNAKDTFTFLSLLLLCALISAWTVVHHAWGDVTRNRFKLVLHVVIIVTSVIPPELPMELSLAVTTSLGELIKRYQVYCTEPFRIPLAGLVDVCCFDKTGTLTSDELRLHGVRLPATTAGAGDGDNGGSKKNEGDEDLILFDDILSKSKSSSATENGDDTSISIGTLLPRETLRVMVGCQSLAITHVLAPGKDGRTTIQTELCGDPLEKAVMEGCGFTIHPKTDSVVEKATLTSAAYSASTMNGGGSSMSIKVLHRFAFSSKLRRMTVLATDASDAKTDADGATLWALTKGAPEALKPMLDPKSLPDDYEASYLRHMALGRRVLALAYRNLGKNNTTSSLAKWKSSRDKVEQKLTFGGLLIMDSPLKADSARVIKELRIGLSSGSGSGNEKSNNNVVMVTGDAVLTAAEVARRVGIVDAPQELTYELVCHDADGTKEFVFRPLDHSIVGTEHDANGKDRKDDLLPYTSSSVTKLREFVRDGKANFCVTGDVLTKLAIHAVELATALAMTNKSSASTRIIDVDDRAILNHPAAKSALTQLVPLITVFARHAPRHKEAVINAFNASGRHTLMCGDGTNDVGALKAAHVGVSIVSVPDLEAKQRSAEDVIRDAKAEEKRERKKAKKSGKSSSSKKPKRGRADRVERSLQALAEAEDELNFVSLGNASVASPFTSRKTSVQCCKDILQQGRCTLVTMITIYKILGVQCLVNALVLTKLHQKGVKQGDRQMTAVGLVVSVLFLFVTRGKPLPKLSPNKPPASVLCKGTLLSIAVQFGIHFIAIMAVTNMSDAYVDPYDPSIVPDGPFHPNTLNTATFLITVLASINAFLVNYCGRPYMEDLRENKLLYRSIQGCYFILGVCALEVFTPLNQLLQLSPMPSSGPPLFNLAVEVSGSGHGYYGFANDLLLEAVSLAGFRAVLCAVMCLDTAMVTLVEKTIRSVVDN